MGSKPGTSGGGMNYLCAPNSPYNLGRPPNKVRKKVHLYGIFYDKIGDLFSRDPSRNDDYKAIPCAVCEAKRRPALFMFPAQSVCPEGWMREYHGYLMAQNSNNSRAEFICVDADADSIAISASHSKVPNGGALLTTVEGKCGILECPPYTIDQELTCAVCTL